MIFDDVERVIYRVAGAVRRRANGMIRRAVIKLVNDDKLQQETQVEVFGENEGAVEHFQAYGFTSNPPVDSECLIVRVGGAPEHQIAIASAKRDSRPKVAVGEVKIYTDDGDAIVHVKEGGEVVITCGTKVTIDAPDVSLGGTGGLGVVRLEDLQQSTIVEDPNFWAWVIAATAQINANAAALAAPGVGLPVFGVAAASVAPVPTAIVSKAIEGSATVTAVD